MIYEKENEFENFAKKTMAEDDYNSFIVVLCTVIHPSGTGCSITQSCKRTFCREAGLLSEVYFR